MNVPPGWTYFFLSAPDFSHLLVHSSSAQGLALGSAFTGLLMGPGAPRGSSSANSSPEGRSRDKESSELGEIVPGKVLLRQEPGQGREGRAWQPGQAAKEGCRASAARQGACHGGQALGGAQEQEGVFKRREVEGSRGWLE